MTAHQDPIESLLDVLRGDEQPLDQWLAEAGFAHHDWPHDIDIDALSEDEQRAVISSVATQRLRERGEVPPHYTEIVECAGCGPVWLFAATGDRVLACPWCLNRAKGLPVPRP